MSPQLLRDYVVILTRDILPPLAGSYLVWKGFPAYELPLVVGLFGIPFVAPRKPGDPE